MTHYYYHRWYYPGDEFIGPGLYHTTIITPKDWKDLVSTLRPTQELFLKEFGSEAEMQQYAASNGLPEPRENIKFRCHQRTYNIWQKLFDYYRVAGGNLARLDNLLTDHVILTNFDTGEFLWGAVKFTGVTCFLRKEDWADDNIDTTADLMMSDIVIHVIVSETSATFKVIKQ